MPKPEIRNSVGNWKYKTIISNSEIQNSNQSNRNKCKTDQNILKKTFVTKHVKLCKNYQKCL